MEDSVSTNHRDPAHIILIEASVDQSASRTARSSQLSGILRRSSDSWRARKKGATVERAREVQCKRILRHTRLVAILEVQALRASFQYLPYRIERVAQCKEGVFARRSIDDLIDSKAKDLRGTAGHSRKAVTLGLYRGAWFNDNNLSFAASRVPKNEMPFGNNPS